MIRAFIGVDVEPTEEIRAIYERLKQTQCELKLVSLHQIHITLRFLGDIAEERVEEIGGIIKSCSPSKELTLKLRGMGAFPNLNHINVVWIGIANPGELERTSTCINQKLLEIGFPKEDKPFSPHLTLARLKSNKSIGEMQRLIKENVNRSFGDVVVKAIHLKRSVLKPDGPVYTNLFTHHLT